MFKINNIKKLYKPKCFIFDWDGTLIESDRALLSAMNATRKKYNKSILTLEEWKDWVGVTANEAFPKEFGEEWEQAKADYLATYQRTHLFKINKKLGAQELLNNLKAKDITSCIISNKSSILLQKEIFHFNWQQHFFSVIGANDTNKSKPDPEPVKKALSLTDMVGNSNIWFIGDNIVDIQCAKASDCTSVFIGDFKEKSKQLIPDLIVENLQQLELIFEATLKD